MHRPPVSTPGLLMSAMIVLFALTGGGCALVGRTKPQAIAMPAEMNARLDVRSVELEPGQTHLQNVGTFAWGEYGARDVAALEETIRTTLATASAKPEAPQFQVHVVVRRFLVAHSNNEGFAVACVAWALTDAQGVLRFHEQFYASDYVRLWGTIGGIKNHVHEGITRHITQQAARVSAGGEPAEITAPYTYPTYEAASARFPGKLTSIHFQALYLGGGYSFRAVRIDGDSQRDWARQDDHIDWAARLGTAA